MNYAMRYASPLGRLWLVEQDGKLAGVWMEGQKYFFGSIPPDTVKQEKTPLLQMAARWLDRYFSGQKPCVEELPLAPIGTPFRKKIWEILCEIPYGQVATYGEIARKFASRYSIGRMSAQAVGGAVGHNPLSIIIPCHRVVGANGSLVGYAGGLRKKTALLSHEGLDMRRFFIPQKGTAL